MKLAVLGGGGVRSPFLSQTIAQRAKDLNIDKVVFMDNQESKLNIYGAISKKIASILYPELDFKITTDPIMALKDADFIITTLRVGGDKGRIHDEKIALKHGVLGQETTGAGGFAMAMRSIPEILKYCNMAKKYSKPEAIIFNFTNPSGLVTQAVRDEGFERFYGICDAPSGFIQEIANLLGEKEKKISVECFGLNHLSWFRKVEIDSIDKTEEILNNPKLFKETEDSWFDPELVKSMGMLLNGYLYYYYHREKAINNIEKTGRTRGEAIFELNKQMDKALSQIDIDNDFEDAIRIYLEFMEQRKNSYMSIESGSTLIRYSGESSLENFLKSKDEGYAGVALGIIEAMSYEENRELIISVPNESSINGLENNDVVEITCNVNKDGIKPIYIGGVPEIQMSLIRQVKLYERLAAKSIREKNKKVAIQALMVHPLVNSYSLAKNIVNEYIEIHKDYIGEWK